MATVNFLYRSTRKEAPLTLRLLFRHNNDDSVISEKTNLILSGDYWKKHKTRTKDVDLKNQQLRVNFELQKIENHVLNAFNLTDIKKVNKDWLTKQINLYYNPITKIKDSKDVLYWINKIISEAHLRDNGKGGVGLGDSRINSYKRLSELFSEFQEEHTYTIDELTKRKFDDFKKWLLDFKTFAISYAFKKIGDLKTVCKEARENGIEVAQDLDSVKIKQGKTYDVDMDVITLSHAEIKKIEQVELETPALCNARKWLILACFTGQRGKSLTERIVADNFKEYGDDLIIKFRQRKGNKSVTIPVLPKVKEILESGLPYYVSVQKLNKHFKTIGIKAKIDTPTMGRLEEVIVTNINGIEERIRRGVKKVRPKYQYLSTHIGRKTFSTLHYNVLPRPVIMKVTGHSKESTFLSYINESSDEHIDIFLDYYKTKERKAQKEPKLNVVKKAN